MSAPSVSSHRRGRLGWLAGALTLLLLSGFGVLLGVPSAATRLPPTAASDLVPVDAVRGAVTLEVSGTRAAAELSEARLPARSVPGAFSTTAYAAVDPRVRADPGTVWFRESVVPVDGSLPARLRLHTVDDRGVWLAVQDWGDLGIAFDGLLELPADVGAGRSWSSSGAARAVAAGGALRFTSASTATTPADPARAAEGCLTVTARTELAGTTRSTWTETSLWCPGKGVVAGSGELAGTAYAVTSGAAATPVTPAELAPVLWDVADLSSWRLRTRSVLAGDPTFGLVDAAGSPALDPGGPPVVDAAGVVVLPTVEGGDLAGLVDRDGGLWAHWWARPGGQVTALAAVGSLVVAPTTAHRVSAYRAGHSLVWNAPLDDVAVAPPLATDAGVAVATVSGRLTLLDPVTGAARWSSLVGGGVHTPLAAGRGVVVTADTGSTVTAWDLATGERRWQVGDVANPFATTLLVAGDQVVVAAGGTVAAYAVADGHQTWRREAGLNLGAVTVVGDQLWLAAGDDLEAWSPTDGTRRWRSAGLRPVTTPPSGCSAPGGATLGLARGADALVAVDGSGAVRSSWALPVPAGDELGVTCRGAGADLVAYPADGSRPLTVLRLGAR